MARDYDEKRDFIRMCMECPMSFSRPADGQAYEARAKDLSSSGFSFTANEVVTVGEVLEVRVIPGKAVVPPLHAEVEVVRVQPAGDGYEIGATIKRFF